MELSPERHAHRDLILHRNQVLPVWPDSATRERPAMVVAVARIVTIAHRYKRPLRKTKAAPLAVPAIVKTASKGKRIPRREEADQAREVSAEEEAKAEAFIDRVRNSIGRDQ